ncbi:hypothetical protein CF392_06875 [Tamilnaduibacter salinus]|uniref:Uncharacterized protein n=1 Tax=Tamilnaduibacter salinus TaxID=1484056 RepID=A0A2A2I2I0_9GAMM|nr:hypothetical protein [Tamilnaduibacter salinus]PAV26231.1 hypothetical protein CF392_06875 [Tamilnaduibacter salinus]
MNVTRKPVHIFFTEHLLYSAYMFVWVMLAVYFAPKLLARYPSVLPPEVGIWVLPALTMLPIIAVLYFWLPFSAIRLWYAAGNHHEGFGQYAWRAYAAVVFGFLGIWG